MLSTLLRRRLKNAERREDPNWRRPDDVVVIFDSGVAPLHVNLVTELIAEDGTVRISFAATTQDGEGQKTAEIVTRLRMNEDTAYALCRALRALHGV
jgi:dihydroxyacetone kinase DhaKLM complex PTS-EIIA-like component DhaM